MRDSISVALGLGLANAVVVAVGLAIAVPSRDLAGAIAVLAAPSLPIGAVIGGIAMMTEDKPVWLRRVWLMPLPLGYMVVVLLGLGLGPAGYGALIPTSISVLLLERWSRPPPTDGELPRARATTRS